MKSSIGAIFGRSIVALYRNYFNFFKALILSLIVIVGGIILWIIGDQLLFFLVTQLNFSIKSLATLNRIYLGLGSLIAFLLGVWINSLIINSLMAKPKTALKEIVHRVKTQYWSFAFLSLYFLLFIFVASLPLYLIASLFFFETLMASNMATIFYILLSAGFVALSIYYGVYLALTPFVMFDQKLKAGATLKKNKLMLKGKFFKVLSLLIIPFVIFVPFASTMEYFPIWYQIAAGLINLLIITPFLYIYINNIYLELKD